MRASPLGGAGPLVNALRRFPLKGHSTARHPVERLGRVPRERRRAAVPPAGAAAACAGSGARSVPESRGWSEWACTVRRTSPPECAVGSLTCAYPSRVTAVCYSTTPAPLVQVVTDRWLPLA